MNTLIFHFLRKFDSKFLFLPRSSFLVAVSGGQDSISLLFILFLISQQRQIKPIYIHYNHLWQKESTQFMFQLLQISFANKTNILLPISFSRLKNENISRIWRYQCLERLNFFTQSNLVLTGHTNSDKVESCLMNLIRGSSTKGITSIAEKRNITWIKYRCFSQTRVSFDETILIYSNHSILLNKIKKTSIYREEKWPIVIFRPFILINRYEVMNISQFFLLPIWTDKTNFQFKYFRNRVRYQILPAIRYFLNPNVDISILRYIDIINEQNNYLNLLTLKMLTYSIYRNGKQITDKTILFHKLFILKQLPLILKKKILVNSLRIIGYKSINSNIIQNLISLLFLISYKKRNKTIHIFFYSNSLNIIFTENYLILEYY